MTKTAADLLKAAMELPVDEREEVAERLLFSVSPEWQEETERWSAEAERRYAAYKDGKVPAVDYRDAIRSSRERLK